MDFTAAGVEEIDHYLHDFITMGPSGSQVCGRNLNIIFQACEEPGVPLAMEKLEDPTTRLIFLDIANCLLHTFSPVVTPL